MRKDLQFSGLSEHHFYCEPGTALKNKLKRANITQEKKPYNRI